MKKTLILILSMIPFALQAQRIHAYVTSGVTMAQVEGDELKGFRHIGFNGGVGALTALDDKYRWGLSVEALFMQKGIYNNDHSTGNLYNTNITLNYVEIPLLFHYQDPYGGMLFGMGLSYGRLVQQPHGELHFAPNYFVPDTSDMSFLKNDLSIAADMRFTIWHGLQLNIRWQYSLLAIKKDWLFTEYVNNIPRKHTNDCYNNCFTLRLIWQF